MALDHPYFYTANSRLTLFADEFRWAIVFAKNGYGNRTNTIDLELNFFGNCLHNLARAGADDRYVCNAKFLTLVDGDALSDIEAGSIEVPLSATSVRLRCNPVQIPSTKEEFAKWGRSAGDTRSVAILRHPAAKQPLVQLARSRVALTEPAW
jgi:hypothetical protein